MKKLRSRLKYVVLGFIPFAPFLFFMATMHFLSATSGLSGYRGGPQDAFRHTLAAAYVSRYLGGGAVDFFTELTERNLESAYDRMDWHNNAIGKTIGTSGVKDIYQAVRISIQNGQVNAKDPAVSTWLPESKWVNFLRLLGVR